MNVQGNYWMISTSLIEFANSFDGTTLDDLNDECFFIRIHSMTIDRRVHRMHSPKGRHFFFKFKCTFSRRKYPIRLECHTHGKRMFNLSERKKCTNWCRSCFATHFTFHICIYNWRPDDFVENPNIPLLLTKSRLKLRLNNLLLANNHRFVLVV